MDRYRKCGLDLFDPSEKPFENVFYVDDDLNSSAVLP